MFAKGIGMSVIEAMARAQYDKYMSGVSDLEPEWSGLQESHRTRMRESLCAALKAAEALGWKLVPVEPTVDMNDIGAGVIVYESATDPLDHTHCGEAARDVYRAMIAASPSIEGDG